MRNRERVLEAAKAVFSAGGPEASLEAVARRAGVGIGTLYRHFPTREALFEAVYRREVEQLADLAEQLKADDVPPAEALRRWLRANVEFVATKKGMSAALALAAHSASELSAYSFERLTKAVGALLDRAAAAGEIRADVEPGGPAARADRHVLSARSAGLAGERAAAGRRVRRRAAQTTGPAIVRFAVTAAAYLRLFRRQKAQHGLHDGLALPPGVRRRFEVALEDDLPGVAVRDAIETE